MMKDTQEIYKSLENPNYCFILYKIFNNVHNEIIIEVNDKDKPKYPLVFSILKRCEPNEAEATITRLRSIVDAEFPGNTWQLL